MSFCKGELCEKGSTIAIADGNERMQEMLGNVIKQDDTLELIGADRKRK